ncbi:cox cluster protein [Natronoarchaeum mannanilyticum]|uniref:Cox cluster protein n=1 Tax=Natronoarchaeum mannanilyticum TaxID=926360 RepID=A0AAV3TDW5_9EURY
MTEEPGLSDQYRKSSPWPLLIALGLPLSEIGIFLGLYPVAVGGLLLLLGSIAGILRETEYVSSPWPVFAGMSAVLIAAGIGVFFYVGGSVDGGAVTADGLALRGLSIATAGVIGVVGAVVGRSRTRAQPGV